MALCPANTLTDLRPGNFLISTQPSGKQRAWKAAIRTGRMGRSGTGRRYRGCRRGRRMQATTLKTKGEPQGSCSPLHMLGSAPSPCHAHSPHAAAATYAAPCASHTCTLMMTAPFAEALILAWAFMSNEARGHKCWYLKIRCGASGVAPPRGFVASVVTVHQRSVSAPLLATSPCSHPQPAVPFILETLPGGATASRPSTSPFRPPEPAKWRPVSSPRRVCHPGRPLRPRASPAAAWADPRGAA